MKALRHIPTLSMIFILSLFLVNCEKVNPKLDLVADPDSEIATTQQKAAQISSIDEIIYLMSLIEDIESLVEEGLLNKGQANALIVKIENSIKSIEKGNTNAAENQLTAFISQSEDFVENEILTEEQGESLINAAETGIILTEGSFIDPRDGQEYAVVLIGEQLWMAENLKATKFNDGIDIPLVTENEQWSLLQYTLSPAYCWYNNDYESLGITYGALYNWPTIATGNLSPLGWHVPTNEEWIILAEYLGGYLVAGNKLKEAGDIHWQNPYSMATNESGFTALPGGYRWPGGEFSNLGTFGHWWSSTMLDDSGQAWFRTMDAFNSFLWPDYFPTTNALSVRCIKD